MAVSNGAAATPTPALDGVLIGRGDAPLAALLSARNLGIASDVVSMGVHGVTIGFAIAKYSTNFGFGIASTSLRAPAEGLEKAAGPNALSQALHSGNSLVQVAHTATAAGQDLAQAIVHASLGMTRLLLAAAGARQGELLRLAVGEEAAEAIIAVEALVRGLAGPMSIAAPLPQLLVAARAWGALQRAASAIQGPPTQEVALPRDTERWLRFTAATFGAVWFAGFVEGLPAAAVRAHQVASRGGNPGEAALACAGILGQVQILAFEQRCNEVFAPGFLVAADHDTGCVVVALRGTASIADALADLVCEPAHILLGGHAGSAHGGMLKAALGLESKLAAAAESGLELLAPGAPRSVVICGHSLGAGVASLVAALWRDSGRFQGTHVRCFAFACPQVLDSELALAQSNHTTSFIVGDDLVPRLSLATARDLRTAMLLLSSPASSGIPSLRTAEVLVAEGRNDIHALATAYAAIRPQVCTSSGRLFPSGHLIQLAAGMTPREVGHESLDELVISGDMVAAHMPRRYLLAVQEASNRG